MQRAAARFSAVVVLAVVAGLLSGRPGFAAPRGKVLAVVYPLPPVSIATMHLLELKIANVSSPDRDQGRTTLVVRARLLDAHGVELARSETSTLPLGATFRWRIARASLAGVPADPSGRIPVRAEVDLAGTVGVGAFVPSLELVNELTGAGGGMIGDVRTVISGEAAFQSANQGFF